MRKGKLVVLEGADACGKGTQAKLLLENLRSEGYNVALFSFPHYETATGQKVAAYLRGEMPGITLRDKSRLYAENRAEDREKLIFALRNNDFVICNRYAQSEMAYGSASLRGKERKKYLAWLEDLEFKKLKLPQADVVIFFDVPPLISQKLLLKKQTGREYLAGRKKDIHEADLAFQKKVRRSYLRLAKEKNWQVIACCSDNQKLLSPKKISEKVLKIVLSVFGK